MWQQSIMFTMQQVPDHIDYIQYVDLCLSEWFRETYSAFNRKTQIVKKVQHTTHHLFDHINFSDIQSPCLFKYRGHLGDTTHSVAAILDVFYY